ncbi:MAG: maltose alpha-D-glucosyltransferase [Dehalococcoidia bacterium]
MTTTNPQSALPNDPLWYKDAIIYELYVRTFQDGTGDGTGDFKGLAQRLDYLAKLGINCLWLLPFYPSPMRDGGYDIADYTSVHPDFGTMRDFRQFIRAAHARGIRVITELVINHTSDQHAWFQKARRAPRGSAARSMYVWSDDPSAYSGTRIIFTDTETSNWAWDPVAEQYYWHRFFSHQPDLNYANPRVRSEVKRIIKFWLDAGVDGLRLDAVPYLCEREGTNNENLPETHAVLKDLRAYVDAHWEGRMLLAEANQWPEDVIAYFGDGDECNMAFHFPVMPRLFMALRQEDRHPITDILAQTPAIHESCQWGLFLRNHDELTLEMVTDEERDYMYSAYAADPQMRVNVGIRRRLAPLMQNNRRAIELLNSLLFALPGTPILYYGDELGMGDNVFLGDRDGVRTPMQWTGDRNAGFSSADPARLYLPVIADPLYGYQAVNVEAQERTPSSFLNWMRRLIALRRERPVFGRGTLEMLHPENRRVLAFVRRHEDETVLVVANLSRFVQPVELELPEFAGLVPVEMLGQTPFPVIDDGPMRLALGPHSFYWFSLTPQPQAVASEEPESGVLPLRGDWAAVVEEPAAGVLERDYLPGFLAQQRWFGGKARTISGTRIVEVAPLQRRPTPAWWVLVRVTYEDGGEETYHVPLAVVTGRLARRITDASPSAVLARLGGEPGRGLLVDAMECEDVALAMLEVATAASAVPARHGELRVQRSRILAPLVDGLEDTPAVRRVGGEQSNTSVRFDQQLILKVLRRVEAGVHPAVEMERHLTRAGFEHSPRLGGTIAYAPAEGDPMALAMLQEFVWNQGDGWSYTIDQLVRYFEETNDEAPPVPGDPVALAAAGTPAVAAAETPYPDPVYHDNARTLGVRTAEMHLALARSLGDADFEPTPIAREDLEAVMRRIVARLRQSGAELRARRSELPEELQADLAEVLEGGRGLLTRLRPLTAGAGAVSAIRVHGDYHLGQLLWARNDFMIIDFEGEVGTPIEQRRARACALTDVAGMLRSFEYAADVGLRTYTETVPGMAGNEQLQRLAAAWTDGAVHGFIEGYVEAAGDAPFLPHDREQFRRWLDLYLLDKALHELEYELAHRPAWVPIPLRAVARLLRGLR